MKICFIGASVGTNNESQETVIFQMANFLGEKHDVTLITGRSRARPLLKRFENANFKVVTVPYWPRNTSLNRLMNRIFKKLDSWKIESFTLYYSTILRPSVKRKIKEADVILTYYRLDSRLFSNLAYKYGVPCISTFQYSGFDERFFKIDKSVMYLTNSKFSKESLENKHDIKIEGVVTPGISEELIEKDFPVIPEIKNRKSLLFVGHLRRQKGVFELIDLFKMISDKHEDSFLYIIGSGDEMDTLTKKIQSLDLTGRVIFVGRVGFEDMPSYYKSATLMIHPSHEETFGMVVLEALASGLPVIATDIPSLREIAEGTAILLSIDDLNSWAEKIDYLLEDTAVRKEMVKKGIDRAKDYLWKIKAKQLEEYIEKAAKYKGRL
jgi:glycosyltransferase involved in cell wall biosynthesis